MAKYNRITIRFDEKTGKYIDLMAKEYQMSKADFVRKCVCGERNDLDKMTKMRISSQVDSIKDDMAASAANINANISALREQIEEMQYRIYATWVFFSKPRKEIESVDNVLYEVENITAEIMKQDKELEAKEREQADGEEE